MKKRNLSKTSGNAIKFRQYAETLDPRVRITLIADGVIPTASSKVIPVTVTQEEWDRQMKHKLNRI